MKKFLLIVFFTLVFFATKFANAKEIQILCVPEMEEYKYKTERFSETIQHTYRGDILATLSEKEFIMNEYGTTYEFIRVPINGDPFADMMRFNFKFEPKKWWIIFHRNSGMMETWKVPGFINERYLTMYSCSKFKEPFFPK
tara:strand:- start:484 stop:906 length:423 start_codon:yes stop_codon:yes gene_type:complete